MSSEFYKIYHELLSKSRRKVVEDANTTGSVGIASNAAPGLSNQDTYAPGDARGPKAMFKGKIQKRQDLKKIKGIQKPKEI